ncbi:hypothetical protein D3C87_1076630 [compost metagenome]
MALMHNANVRGRDGIDGGGLSGAVENRARNLARNRRQIHVNCLSSTRAERDWGGIILRACPCPRNGVIFSPTTHNDRRVVLVAQHLGKQVIDAEIRISRAVAIDEDVDVLPCLELGF